MQKELGYPAAIATTLGGKKCGAKQTSCCYVNARVAFVKLGINLVCKL